MTMPHQTVGMTIGHGYGVKWVWPWARDTRGERARPWATERRASGHGLLAQIGDIRVTLLT